MRIRLWLVQLQIFNLVIFHPFYRDVVLEQNQNYILTQQKNEFGIKPISQNQRRAGIEKILKFLLFYL